jgi:hypothetical protein
MDDEKSRAEENTKSKKQKRSGTKGRGNKREKRSNSVTDGTIWRLLKAYGEKELLREIVLFL